MAQLPAPNITSAEEGAKLDSQNRSNFLTNLGNESTNPVDKLRIQRKVNNLATEPVPQNIDASSLGARPLTVASEPTSTLADGITGRTPGIVDAFSKQLADDTAARQTEMTAGKGKIQSVVDAITGKQNERAAAEGDINTPGTPAFLKETARKAANSLDLSQRAQVNELKALDSQNLTDSGRAAASKDINRKYAMEQADLQLSYHLANSDYTAVEDTLNKKLELELEPLKLKLQTEQNFYNDNKDDWTKAEDRQFQQKLAVTKNEYDIAKDTRDTINKLYLEAAKAGASSSVLSRIANSGSIQEAAGAANVGTNGAVGVSSTVTPGAKQALSVILGSGKFTKDQVKLVTNAISNGEDPFTVIKNQAKSILGTEGKDITKFESAKSAMEQLDSALKTFYAQGGKSNIFSGNFEKVSNNLGKVNDPKLVDLAVQIAASIQKYRNAISGTAYSEQEGKDINSIFPGINKGELLNSTIVKARLKTLDSDIDGLYRTALGSAYDDLKKGQNQQQIISLDKPVTTKSGKSFDMKAAKDAGYTEIEIQSYLNNN